MKEGKSLLKTVGVLGGLGPQATMDFEARVHAVSQQLIEPQGNSGYPPMVVYYHRHAPVVLAEDGSPLNPLQPDPSLLEAARKLGEMADFLVITSNSVHLMRDMIEKYADRPVLNMIDMTLGEVSRRGWRRIGVLTFLSIPVYTTPLYQQGIVSEFNTI